MTRRFQFSLRGMLVVAAVLAAPCAWVANNVHVVRQRQASMNSNGALSFATAKQLDEQVGVPWLRWQLGDEPVLRIHWDAADDSGLAEALELFPEAEVWVADKLRRSPEIELPPRHQDDKRWFEPPTIPYIEQQPLPARPKITEDEER